eukprot:TRINITY_DN1399_c0_g1_i4.p2 TRINITY_DN1399_c0_g1~~TRINITY_DN1399_c0_g1_i4.p2  ORF type:complete len:122 (-),score=10.83 TRINITY_DN1399_c0_g1_i4:432-776(-)
MQAEEALTAEILVLQRMQGQLRRQRLFQAEQAEERTATQAAWGEGKDSKPEQRHLTAERSFKGRKKRAIRSREHRLKRQWAESAYRWNNLCVNLFVSELPCYPFIHELLSWEPM